MSDEKNDMWNEDKYVHPVKIPSQSNERVKNNALHDEYRILSEEEKAMMVKLKDLGQEFLDLLDTLGESRENSIAAMKMEEAVMWAVRGLTK